MTVQLLFISHFFQMVPNIPIVPNAVDKEKYADAETEWAAAFQQKMEQLSGSVSIPGTSVSSPLQVRAAQLLLTRCEVEGTALLVYAFIGVIRLVHFTGHGQEVRQGLSKCSIQQLLVCITGPARKR
jgi:hypothetical protein